MSVLASQHLRAWAEAGGLEPYNPECINSASVDLCISPTIIQLTTPGIELPCRVIDLWPGLPILATTVEYIKLPDNLAGVIYLKSTWARRGLDHALAGWIDPGFEGEITLELHAHRPLTINPGDRVVQMVLHRLIESTDQPYQGKYQGQRGATRAR